MQGDITFNDPFFHRREITLLSSRNALPCNFTRIIALMESGQVSTTPWITHRTPYADLAAASRSGWNPAPGCSKGCGVLTATNEGLKINVIMKRET